MAVDPNIKYEGYVLPRDAGKRSLEPNTDPNIDYAGVSLPKGAKTFVPFKDVLNKPGEIFLNNGFQEIMLPPDTVIIPDDEKLLVRTEILDGVSAFERILRLPMYMEFHGTFRMQAINGTRYNNTTPPAGLIGMPVNVWPQEYINDVWQYVFLPDTVLIIKNSFLNGIGIQQVIVEKFGQEPARGTTDVRFRLQAWENVDGPSLLISGG